MTRTIGLTLSLSLLGCVVSPQPEPPGLDGIAYRADSLEGAPGTIAPAEGELRVIALFDMERPTVTPVIGDGSFGPVPFTAPGPGMMSWARAVVRVGDTRSETIDFQREMDRAVPITFPIPCVAIARELEFGEVEVGVPARASVTLTNNCADSVQINDDATGFRFGDQGFTPDFLAPIEIPIGGSFELLLDLIATAPGEASDVLSLDIRRNADRDRRFVSLFGVAR